MWARRAAGSSWAIREPEPSRGSGIVQTEVAVLAGPMRWPEACFLMLLACAVKARGEITLPSVFSDHAVLQRDKPIPVWGKALPGERVSVSLGGNSRDATADAAGRWRLMLPPMPADGRPQTLEVKGAHASVSRSDILLGDVWLCSGQSNMEWGLGGCDVPQDIAAADLPRIRNFHAAYQFAETPTDDVSGSWAVCSPGSAPGITAAGFYFARRIHAETGVPVGLLTSAVGGTNIELWMSAETLLKAPELSGYAGEMRASLALYQNELRGILPAARSWVQAGEAAAKAGREIPPPPVWPAHPFSDRVMRPRCVLLHQGMIHPLAPYALRGVLWYQGENNAGDPQYAIKKRLLIGEWRSLFRDPELPFYFVQLAAFEKPDEQPAGGGWGHVRDFQRRCLEIPRTGMACAIDIGDAADIHPKNKEDVGERLALWALHDVYQKPGVVPSGPLYQEMSIEGDRIRLRFGMTGGGLMVGRKPARGRAVPDPDEPLRRFAIAGEDRRWFWAQAMIEGGSVTVRSPEVPRPVAVRYAFSSNPEGANLYNREGLPASPFRTDDW